MLITTQLSHCLMRNLLIWAICRLWFCTFFTIEYIGTPNSVEQEASGEIIWWEQGDNIKIFAPPPWLSIFGSFWDYLRLFIRGINNITTYVCCDASLTYLQPYPLNSKYKFSFAKEQNNLLQNHIQESKGWN